MVFKFKNKNPRVFEILLNFILVMSEMSFIVFGVSSSLQAKYIEAHNIPSVVLPSSNPNDDAFL
jgi:hypothetical protein